MSMTMMPLILIISYIVLGLIQAFFFIKDVKAGINNRKEGAGNDADTEEGLRALETVFESKSYNYFIVFTCVIISMFWLPMAFFRIYKKIIN